MEKELRDECGFEAELDEIRQMLEPEAQERAVPPGKGQPQGALWELYTWVHDLGVCLLFVTLFFVYAVRLVGVVGPSMTPTLLNGDQVALLSNFLYQNVENGDIVVLQVPSYNTDEAIVKRVIATEGQTVEIDFDAGTVTVDGVTLDEPYIYEQMTWPSYLMEWEYPITVPEGCIFVLGDNRNHSADSRYPSIGMVDTRYVLGKVVAILWPFSRLGGVS